MTNTVGNTLSSKDYYRILKSLNKEVIFKDIPRGRVNAYLKRLSEGLYSQNKIDTYDTKDTILVKTYNVMQNNYAFTVWHKVYAPGIDLAVLEFLVAYRVAYGIHRFLGTV